MSLSVFDIFKIGIGPSSSHTMGPMNAARGFVELLAARDLLARTCQVSAQLYGSLALTGRGHCTDRAILLGLEGMSPDTIDSAAVEPALQRIRTAKRLRLLGAKEIEFDEPLNLLFHTDQVLPGHSNGMRFTAHDASLVVLAREEYYSIGGGFVVRAGAESAVGDVRAEPPYRFGSGAELLEHGRSCLLASAPGAASLRCAPGSCASGRSCRIACGEASMRRVCCRASCASGAGRQSCIAS
jgi:L-serine dehydratase